jgi:hypothetical protein
MTAVCTRCARDPAGKLSSLEAVRRTISVCRRLVGPADVAQLAEHFTRNEGVGGSSPPVGFPGAEPNSATRAAPAAPTSSPRFAATQCKAASTSSPFGASPSASRCPETAWPSYSVTPYAARNGLRRPALKGASRPLTSHARGERSPPQLAATLRLNTIAGRRRRDFVAAGPPPCRSSRTRRRRFAGREPAVVGSKG